MQMGGVALPAAMRGARNPPPPEGLTATSQQSRFHTAPSASGAQLIDIRDVQLSFGTRDLLMGAHLRLEAGTHYGLIGRNGVGKSALLKALAYRWLPGVPPDLKVFYVDQLEDSASSMQGSVLEAVVRADAEHAQRADQVAALERALATGGLAAMRAALLANERLEDAAAVDVAHERAERTSGQRGVAARKELVKLEAALAAVALDETVPVDAALQSALTALYDVMEPAAELEARAERVLLGLGFTHATLRGPVRALSGGWRMRLALAMAVYLDVAVILLDEPTNHLDLPGIVQLRSVVAGLDGVTLVTVSHDRAFLDDVADEIILLQGGTLTYYAGNYDAYIAATSEARAARARARAALEKQHDAKQASIREEKGRARKAADPKKLAQLASRQRKLDERHGVEVNAKGHRFKLNRDRAGYFLNARDGVAAEHVDSDVHWRFPEPGELRTAGPLITLQDVAFMYPGGTAPVLEGVTLTVERAMRMAIVGANGEGKTTLMSLLAGALTPAAGYVAHHPQAAFAHFEQHFVDAARALDASPLQYLLERYPGIGEQEVYGQLGHFGLPGASARQPLKSLSGGQVVRFAMACLALARPTLMLLDEPTNHLDLDTIEALADALAAFPGAVVAISHDAHFVRQLAGDRVYTVANRGITLTDAT